MSLEEIKRIAETMPDGPDKNKMLQSYYNLKCFEVMAAALETA